jgi:hypothetical protein
MAKADFSQDFGRGMTDLLREYAQKLENRLAELRRARDNTRSRKEPWMHSTDWQVFERMFSRIQSEILNATREASQLAEQGAVDDITRIELRLRLADVESLMDGIQTLLYQP